MYVESYCLKGACAPRLFRAVISYTAGARNFGDWDCLGAGRDQPNVHFFLRVTEFFILHRMVGRTSRGVLTPGYFELCNFPSDSVCMNLWESTSSTYCLLVSSLEVDTAESTSSYDSKCLTWIWFVTQVFKHKVLILWQNMNHLILTECVKRKSQSLDCAISN